MAPAPVWRTMRTDDLNDVARIGDAIHPTLPERPEVVAEKLALFSSGAFVLEVTGEVLGYAIAHPSRRGAIPKLDAMLGMIPADADCLYLHDIAILPSSRGLGSARTMIDLLADVARANGLRALALTSVYETQDFWTSCGFAPSTPRDLSELASYGGPAIYMTRAV